MLLAALTLSAWTLDAQENTPPPKPPESAPREGGQRPEANRPPEEPRRRDGQRSEGQRPDGLRPDGPRPEGRRPEDQRRPDEGGQRGGGDLFSALDANHDGVIDAAELSRAADVLRQFDRNHDSRITRDEFPNGGPRQFRGPDVQVQQRPNFGPRDDSRGSRPEANRQGSDRGNAQPGEPRREGPRPPGPSNEESRRDGFDGAQAYHHRHFRPRGGWDRDRDSRFAQGSPQQGEMRPPQMERRFPTFNRGRQGDFAMGPRMNGERPRWQPQGPGEFRQDMRGPGPLSWRREMHGGPQDGSNARPGDGPQGQQQPGPRGFDERQMHHQHPSQIEPRRDFQPPQNSPSPRGNDPAPRSDRPDGPRPPQGSPPQGRGENHPPGPPPGGA